MVVTRAHLTRRNQSEPSVNIVFVVIVEPDPRVPPSPLLWSIVEAPAHSTQQTATAHNPNRQRTAQQTTHSTLDTSNGYGYWERALVGVTRGSDTREYRLFFSRNCRQ